MDARLEETPWRQRLPCGEWPGCRLSPSPSRRDSRWRRVPETRVRGTDPRLCFPGRTTRLRGRCTPGPVMARGRNPVPERERGRAGRTQRTDSPAAGFLRASPLPGALPALPRGQVAPLRPDPCRQHEPGGKADTRQAVRLGAGLLVFERAAPFHEGCRKAVPIQREPDAGFRGDLRKLLFKGRKEPPKAPDGPSNRQPGVAPLPCRGFAELPEVIADNAASLRSSSKACRTRPRPRPGARSRFLHMTGGHPLPCGHPRDAW